MILETEKKIVEGTELKERNLFRVKEDEYAKLSIHDPDGEKEIDIELEANSAMNLSILASKPIKNLKIFAILDYNSQISIYFADFSIIENNLTVVILLKQEKASVSWHLASLSSKDDKKKIDVSVYHLAPNTYAKVDNYGVAKDNSRLVFSGTSQIAKGSKKSKTQQNAKIMVFDPLSDAIAKPILKIDENDIEASHAAAVGKISDEHIFYLTSRGLSLDDAKRLITLGYLKPIYNGFDEEEIKRLDEIIVGNI